MSTGPSCCLAAAQQAEFSRHKPRHLLRARAGCDSVEDVEIALAADWRPRRALGFDKPDLDTRGQHAGQLVVARSACVQPVAHLQGALARFAHATRARIAQVQVSFRCSPGGA